MTYAFQWLKLALAMGWRYVFFRLFFELKRKTGLLKSAFPVNPHYCEWITLEQWRVKASKFFFNSRTDIRIPITDALKEKATRILNYEVQFFNGEWKKMADDDWNTNPVTGHRYDVIQHWTEIPDFHPVFGDIKYVWERSRFTFLHTIFRYDSASGADSSAWVFKQIESWIKYNPINCGPNYRCSQETSLRVFNWILALYFYRDSQALTPSLFKKIIFTIYWQLKHIRSNIHFSRIAVRNNHAITETLALYTAGLLFPFFEEANEWKTSGRKWFEQEIAYQVYEDGTYLQFSFNYHRVVIQLLTWAISISRIHKEEFDEIVYQRAYASLQVLLHSQDPISGQLPNYGANDGSLFFQWNDELFRDYRPAIDALHSLLTSHSAYEQQYEDRFWFGITSGLSKFPSIKVTSGSFSFKQGGLYGYRTDDMLFWINCPSYKDRPSQADALHLDLWYQGRNLLQDAGSYRYNTEATIVKYFAGTESHNTVMLGEDDQMLKGSRFIWLEWTQSGDAGWYASCNQIVFQGTAYVYRYRGKIAHTRTVQVDVTKRTIIVNDTMTGKVKLPRQLWHIPPQNRGRISFKSDDTAICKELKKFYSPTYGIKEECIQIEFQPVSSTLTTQIVFS
jgi:hypothetical protein